MNRNRLLQALALAIVVMFLAPALWPQAAKKHQVVIELTSDNPEQWQSTLNNIENLQRALGKENTSVELVAHGKGLGLLRNNNDNPAKGRITTIAATGVRFAACENTMRRLQITKQDLLPEATTVDSGVSEVVRRQEAGWSYLKSGS